MAKRLTDKQRRVVRIALRKALIKEHGYQYADFGRRETVYKVVNELRPGSVIRRKIARKLKMKLHDLWPDQKVQRNSGKRNSSQGRQGSSSKLAA